MRKSIKETIVSTVTDRLEADLETSVELMEHIEIAEIVKERKNSKTVSFESLLKEGDINYDEL